MQPDSLPVTDKPINGIIPKIRRIFWVEFICKTNGACKVFVTDTTGLSLSGGGQGFVLSFAVILFVFLFFSCAATGASPGQDAAKRFFAAEKCQSKLEKDPAAQKYRHNWLPCIEAFLGVYRMNPKGPWAAASLYRAGDLYLKLYKVSGAKKDLIESEKLFKKIGAEYKASAYKKRAESRLEQIGRIKSGLAATIRRSTGSGKKYDDAMACYKGLCKDAKKRRFRTNWERCIEQFLDVLDSDPKGEYAAASLFMAGRIYKELYGYSMDTDDLEAGRRLHRRLIKDYPASAYAKKVMEYNDSARKPDNDPIAGITAGVTGTGTAESSRIDGSGGMTEVTNIRYWSNPEYTRVVIDATRETDFANNILRRDPSSNKKYQRLYVDLSNSILGKNIKKMIPIDDALLKDVRAGQYTPDTVRVVVDIKSFESYNIFSLKNPFRIVIDVRGIPEKKEPSETGPPKGEAVSLARQLALGVRRIVIDPGHGGKDYGAPGALKGVHEKDIVLSIAKRLKKKVERELGCDVIMTRSRDTYLTLEERTAIANTKRADLFISIHANASRNPRAYGIETYYLNLTTDNESIAVAARENATSEKNISELQQILNDLMQNAKINESSRLAAYIQQSICGKLKAKYSYIKNKGVKQAPFYVLLGAQMPSILIETSFISNRRECRRLLDPAYQDLMCDAIIEGIKKYIKENRPAQYVPSSSLKQGG